MQFNWPYSVTTIFMLGTMCAQSNINLIKTNKSHLTKVVLGKEGFLGLLHEWEPIYKTYKKEHYASQWHHLLTTVPFAWWWLGTDLLIHQLSWSCFCVFVFVFWVKYFLKEHTFVGSYVPLLKDTSLEPNIFSFTSNLIVVFCFCPCTLQWIGFNYKEINATPLNFLVDSH